MPTLNKFFLKKGEKKKERKKPRKYRLLIPEGVFRHTAILDN